MNKQTSNKTLIILSMIGFFAFILVNMISGASQDESAAEPQTTISKEQATDAAIASLEQLGLTGDLELDVMFQSDTMLSGYLQKNNLLSDYVREHASHYPLDYYQVEITHRDTGVRYLVNIHQQTGKMIGWRTLVSVPAALEDEQLALQFLEEHGIPAGSVAAYSNQLQHGEFIFGITDQWVGDAQYAWQVWLNGDQLAGLMPKYIIPKTYLDWHKQQDNSMLIMSVIAVLLQLLMGIGAIVMTARYHRAISYTRGIFLTITYVAIGIYNNLNMYPAFKSKVVDMHGSASAVSNALAFNMAVSHMLVIVTGVFVYLSLVSGQAVWLAAERNLWARWREATFGKHMLTAMGRGYLLCFVVLGVQNVIFWIAMEYFGMWSTNDPLFSTENLVIPALFPLLAWAAAISEEAIYRLFGIIFLKRIFRSTIVAVLLSSMIWAIGHTSYPVYPAYTRFVEVTILGFLFSWIFLRYGFLTAVFTHAIVNSILMSISLMIMGGSTNVWLGIFYIVLPAIIGWITYLIHDRFGPGRRSQQALVTSSESS